MREALARGHEGVMAKALDAPYAAGRRGASWLKIKQARTLDLVVLAAEWGHGRRRGWLSNLHLGARDPERDGFVDAGQDLQGHDRRDARVADGTGCWRSRSAATPTPSTSGRSSSWRSRSTRSRRARSIPAGWRCGSPGSSATGPTRPRPTPTPLRLSEACRSALEAGRGTLAAVFFLTGVLTVSAQQNPTFSGEWTLSLQASTLSPIVAPAANQEFRGRVIDDAPLLLEQSYRLRYRVYCLQRHFLRAEDYPLGLEHDRFDRVLGPRCVCARPGRRLVWHRPAGVDAWQRLRVATVSPLRQSWITTRNCRTRRTVSWRYRGSRSVAALAQVDTAAPSRPRLDGGPSRRCSWRFIRRPSASGPPTGWRPQRSHSNAELKDTAFHSGRLGPNLTTAVP